MNNAALTETEARRVSIGVGLTQTAYALNNGGIVENQPLVYIDDRTTAGRPGHNPLNLSIPSEFIVRGIFKDRSEPSKNTGADMFVAYDPKTREVGIGIAGTNGVGRDMPDTRSDISLMGADQATWLARNEKFHLLISELGVEAGGIDKLHFIVGGDSLSAVPAIIMPSILVSGLPDKSGQDSILRLGLTPDQFTITNVVPLGANYAADYLGVANNVKTFAQSANIINLTVYNDKSGYDAVTAMGGGSPGRYFQIDAPGDTYSSVASRHQMNYGFTAGLSNIDYDFTRVKPIAMPPLYTHQSINAVTSELAGAQLVENNWVSLSAAGYAGIMLSAPGETASSASKYLQQEGKMPKPLAEVAGVFAEGVVRIGSLAHPAVAIGAFLAGLFAGKALGSKSLVLPSLPKPEAGYTRVIHTDPQTGLVVVVDSGSDRTIVHYADGSRRTYDLEGNVTLNRPDGTTSFRNADGEGMLRIGASGTTVLLNPEDVVDLLPASVVSNGGSNWLTGDPGCDRFDGGAGHDVPLIDSDDSVAHRKRPSMPSKSNLLSCIV